MKPASSIALLLFTYALAQASFAGELCKTSENFLPKPDICLQVKAGLNWWTEGAKTRLSHSDAKAFCESKKMRLPNSQELIDLAKNGAIAAFNVDLDEIFWAIETTADKARHVAIYMSIPDKVAMLDDKDASFLCVSGTGLGMNFIPVPGRSFAMQETEVTRGQWKVLMGYYPEENDQSCTPTVLTDDHPVSCVSALDAEKFADEMTRKNDGHTYRLPSEEEWATAAGDIEGPVYGWCNGNSTHPVKKLKAQNGLYDMVGNVYEWTSSNWDSSSSYRVFRGGGWIGFPVYCRASNRYNGGPDSRYDDVGFRLLRQP
jgi:hypothetical protein